MKRTIQQWRGCDPRAMADWQSQETLLDAVSDILTLYAFAERVARLNSAAGEIGAGMLASLVEQAREQVPAEVIPLAFLEYQPIYEGDILYDKDGKRLQVALPLWTKEYPLRLEVLDKQPGDPDCWATDTHFEGKQVLFWNPPHLTTPISIA